MMPVAYQKHLMQVALIHGLPSTIYWRPVLMVEEAGVPGDNHQPWASNW